MTSSPPPASPDAPGAAPRFDPPVGPVEGWRDGDLVRATGIPYASAGRFERPAPVLNLTGQRNHPGADPIASGDVFPATRFAPCAPQVNDPTMDEIFGVQTRDLAVSEDCLRLSVVAPGDTGPDDRLPVMVWVHGGSYVSGCGDSSITDPAPFVREHRVVVVTVTYRMGVLGFLSSKHAPGNLGLFDIRAAFRWVRRNIAAFGGDPFHVTAFGESAGADAIAHLMAAMGKDIVDARDESAAGSPAMDPEILFDRAILMSPPLGIRKNRSRMNALMSAFVESQVGPDTSMARVLQVQVKTSAKVAHRGLPGMMPFGTQYGHDPLPREADVEAAWGAIAPHIAVMIGTVGTESSLFAHTMPAAQRLKRVPAVGSRAYWKLVEVTSRIVFTKPATEFAHMYRAAGGKAHRFFIPWSVPGNPIRSPHAIDVALLFAQENNWEQMLPFGGATWDDVDRAGRELRRYFAEFATAASDAPATRDPRVVHS